MPKSKQLKSRNHRKSVDAAMIKERKLVPLARDVRLTGRGKGDDSKTRTMPNGNRHSGRSSGRASMQVIEAPKGKRDEERLAEQARLLDLTNDAVIVRDREDRILYWNKGAEEIYGFANREALGKVTHELLRTEHPELLPSILKQLKRNRRWEGELTHYRKDGQRLTVLSRWSLDTNKAGSLQSILETNTDITKRKETERALAESAHQREALYEFVQRRGAAKSLQEMYSAALDTVFATVPCNRAAIFLFDDRGTMRFVDWRGISERYFRAIEVRSPWKTDDENPQPIPIPEIDLADLSPDFKKTLRREGIRAAAFVPLLIDGKLIGQFVAYYNQPHIFTEEELELAVTIGRQLAHGIQRKRGEEALGESEARMRALVEQATAGMARTDRDGRLIFVNRRLCQMFGYSEAEIIGKHVRDFTHPEDQKKTAELYANLLSKATAYEIEKRYIRKDGSILWGSVSASPVRDIHGKINSAVAVLVDISARKKAERELRRSKEMLEELVQQRTQALRESNSELQNEINRRRGLEGQILEISDREQQRLAQELHDGLCQELTAIGFMARATALRVRNHRVLLAEDIDKIATLVTKAATDARNISRALHRVDVDAAGLVDALQGLATREIWKTPCRLDIQKSFQIDDDAAAVNLYGIAREAVVNANKHARAREIMIGLKRSKREIMLTVFDDGHGLKKDDGKSRGMGFHIMNYRAQSIGGRLEVESHKGAGTRISCFLPILK